MKIVTLVSILTLIFLSGCAGIPLIPPHPSAVGAGCPPGSRGTGEVEVVVHEFENRVRETVLCETPDGRIFRGRERVIQSPFMGRYSRDYTTDYGYVGVDTRVERGRRGYRGEATYEYQPTPFWGVTVRARTGGKSTQPSKPREVCEICTKVGGCRYYPPHVLNKKHREKYCRTR